jgi:hypothetical protein
MTSTKLTNRKALQYAIDNLDNEEVVAKLQGMVDALDRKANAERKPTAKQIANEGLKDAIVDFLADNAENGYTVTELIKSVDVLAEASNQKVSALLRQLKLDGKVESYTDKRKSYFRLVG